MLIDVVLRTPDFAGSMPEQNQAAMTRRNPAEP